MFTEFYYVLKNYGVPVSMNEWQTLLEALELGLAGSSLTGFYMLCRSVLVKTEAYYDRFDMAFASSWSYSHYDYGINTVQRYRNTECDIIVRKTLNYTSNGEFKQRLAGFYRERIRG